MVRCVMVLIVMALSLWSVPNVFAQQQLCFDVPGVTNCIEGRFRQYWEQNGGLAVFGYPLTSATNEQTADGTFLTQYFERNRFELHPEKARSYEVLLGRLGDDRLKQQGRDWQDFPKGGQPANCLYFSETGHSICDQSAGVGFRTYWETHGLEDPALSRLQRSIALFGLPLSEPVVETNATGATVITQWFERARFEWYPDNPAQYKVLLGLLGTEIRTARVVNAQVVIDALRAAGLEVENPQMPPRDPESPLPNTYQERVTFEIPSAGLRSGDRILGGQFFVCSTKNNCDALYAYFDALRGLAGPYIYQSPNGLVVMQLNSGLSPELAAKYEAVVKGIQ